MASYTHFDGAGAGLDPETGLVYQGQGRYYDPALGRPLQPHPVGGPPLVPQGLNRYTATPWGPPGVAEVELRNGFNWWTPHIIGLAKNYAVELAGQISVRTGYNYTGQAIIEVIASRTALTRKVPRAYRQNFGALVESEREKFFKRQGTFTLNANSREALEANVQKIIDRLKDTLPSKGKWEATIKGNLRNVDSVPVYGELDELIILKSIRTGIGSSLDFAIGLGFQYFDDIHNPYLNRRQVTSRALLAGSGGALFALVAVSFCPETAGIGCAVAAGTGGGIAWSLIQNPFFELLEHRIFSPLGVHILPVRHLRPLKE